MQQHEREAYGSYPAQDTQEQPSPPVERHMNMWEFLQWLLPALGEAMAWAWDEHPFLSLIFAILLVGLILVLTGHLNGTALWQLIVWLL